MKHLNLQPLDSHGVDFSRVRMWNLNNWARHYRQTLVFSSIQDPQINSILTKHCANYRGQVTTVISQIKGSTRFYSAVCHFESAFLLFYHPRFPLRTCPRQAPSARSWSSCLTSFRCSLLTASWTMMLGGLQNVVMLSLHFPEGDLSLLPPHSNCFLFLFPSQPSGSSSL